MIHPNYNSNNYFNPDEVNTYVQFHNYFIGTIDHRNAVVFGAYGVNVCMTSKGSELADRVFGCETEKELIAIVEELVYGDNDGEG